jgi:hypothetical protein
LVIVRAPLRPGTSADHRTVENRHSRIAIHQLITKSQIANHQSSDQVKAADAGSCVFVNSEL